MSLNDQFGMLLRHFREVKSLSQEQLAVEAGIDRTYVGQLERGEKSPTLTTIEKLATALDVTPAALLEELTAKEFAGLTIDRDYVVNPAGAVRVRREQQAVDVPVSAVLQGVDAAHGLIDQLYDADLDVASMLGMRNLSAFVGELVGAGVVTAAAGLFRKNPHQDGYPDLLMMDEPGLKAWTRLADRHNEKRPFSPFVTGGIEVKATCGSVPTPATSVKRNVKRPSLGDTRIGSLTGYDWKAHHRDTNNLLGVLWDFIDRRPRVAAMMYSDVLNPNDWGRIVSPKDGGGRTTSVSIMASSGIAKMYAGWLCVLREGRYAEFLNRKNGGRLVPQG